MNQRIRKRVPRRKQIPDFPIRIDKLSHEGRGLVQWGERTLFVDGALPGELITVRVTHRSSRIAEGIARAVLVPSPERGQPTCRHAEICGGCSLQHIPHAAQLVHKSKTLDELMTREGISLDRVEKLPTLQGPTLGYLRSARLGVRWVHAKNRVLIGFREKGSKFIADIDGCPVLDQRIGQSLGLLESTIASLSQPDRIPQVEFAAGDDTLAIVIRHLEALCEADLITLSTLGKQTGWHVYLQPKGPDTITRLLALKGPEWLAYRIGEYGLEYQFAVTDFTQVNAAMNRKMMVQAIDLLELKGTERVLDLFCGLGNYAAVAHGVPQWSELRSRRQWSRGFYTMRDITRWITYQRLPLI